MFIIDGNRRWAKEKGLATFIGHKKGTERVGEIIRYARDLEIKLLLFMLFLPKIIKEPKKKFLI